MKQTISTLGIALLLGLHITPIYAQSTNDMGITEDENLNNDFVNDEAQLGGGADTSYYSNLHDSETEIGKEQSSVDVQDTQTTDMYSLTNNSNDTGTQISSEQNQAENPKEFKLYRQGELVKVLSEDTPKFEEENQIDTDFKLTEDPIVEAVEEPVVEPEPEPEIAPEPVEELPIDDTTHNSAGSMLINGNSTLILGGIALVIGVLFGVIILKKGKRFKTSSGMEVGEMPMSYTPSENDKHERLQNALEEMRKET